MKNILIINYTDELRKYFKDREIDFPEDLFDRKSIVIPNSNKSVFIDDVHMLIYEYDLLEDVFDLIYKSKNNTKYYFLGGNNEITKFIQYFLKEYEISYYIISEKDGKMITQSLLDNTLSQIRENKQIKTFCIESFETLKTRMKDNKNFETEFTINGSFNFEFKVSFFKNRGSIDITIDFKTGKNEDIMKNITSFESDGQGNYIFYSILGSNVSDAFTSNINNNEFSESLFNFLFTSML